jgi:hypothetical protein
MKETEVRRRSFLSRLAMLGAAGAIGPRAQAEAHREAGKEGYRLPDYACAQDYRTLKQSSYDRTGGNADAWPVAAGATREIFRATGPGVITHIWFTIAAHSGFHLKEIVLRIYWDGESKPSVETPIGDFFGLNLGEYKLYQSAFMNCSSMRALNCYFKMPFRQAARITVTNEGSSGVGAFYSNIDYQLVPALPENSLYFHAQYRQATPAKAVEYAPGAPQLNKDGKDNYVFMESRGRGHLMGVTLGVLQNAAGWFGEGDEMIFIDDDALPSINGTGTEDYFCGAWDFEGTPFAHLYNGAPLISSPELAGGRYCLYRWHADNPVAFQRYVRYTIEHGHANDRSDNFFSVAYWYQTRPYTDFPPLPPLSERIPRPTA